MDLRAKGCNKIDLSLMDLPRPIFVDILLQISGESIFFCKCTCKFLRQIISDPQFAMLYFARASRSDVYPMIRPLGPSLISRTLYLIDPRLYMLEDFTTMKLKTTFKIQLHDFDMALEIESLEKLNQGKGGVKRKRCFDLNPSDHKFYIVNSCNGLLCLSRKESVVVCNPATGEFVNLPIPSMPRNKERLYAFGFRSSTNTYKVIRLFGITTNKWTLNCRTGYQPSHSSFVEIQILGSGSWKNIGFAPCSGTLTFITFFNGTVNWIYSVWARPTLIVNFDFDNDQFGSFSLPPCPAACKMPIRRGIMSA